MSKLNQYLEMAKEKDSKYGSKKTKTLIISDEELNSINDLEKTKPTEYMFKQSFKSQNATWRVGFIKYGDQWRLFGISGDYGFGVRLTIMNSKTFGNIRVAVDIINQIKNKYNLKGNIE